MKKKDFFDSQLLSIALLWGSLWGIAEATLGHLLHVAGFPGLAGFVMFPLGLFFMTQAFILSGQKKVIFFTALIASFMKLTDLLSPVATPFVVLNPALAIIFESLVVILLLPGKSWIEGRVNMSRFLGMAVSWRCLYAVCVLGLSWFFPVRSFLNLGLSYAIKFFLLESVASGLLIFFVYKSRLYSRNNYSGVLCPLSKSYVSLSIFMVVFLLKILI